MGKQYDSKLLYIEEEFPFATIKGFISNPTAAKKTRGNQYFYANGRYFRSPYFHQMIMKAYEGLIDKETFPAYVFFITLPPNRLDVNVHPSKTEIKFQDEHLIAASINSLTKKALGISGLAPDLDFDAIPTHIFSINSSKSDFNFSKNNYPFPQNPLTDTSQLFKQKINLQRDIIDENYKDLFKEINLIEKDLNLNVDNLEFQIIENRILITKMKDGVLIGDIEAILERLIFERLSQNKNNINSESQQVLFPIVINIEAKFLGTFLSLQTLLENIGFKFEKISNNQFQAIGVPAHGYIKEEDIEDFIYQILELSDTGTVNNMDKIFINLATQGAKKQLSTFTTELLDDILSELFSLPDPQKGIGGKNNFIILSLNNLLQLIQSYE